jgi:glycosyltransferase involved in cell wall biosynthesis
MRRACQIEPVAEPSGDDASKAGPLFTVVIPVFNRRAWLERALRSVLDQTCRDFEIVVVDDGSDDNPGAVIQALNDPRIRLVSQDHRGGNAARNLGIDNASGRFVALLDSDDQFLPHHLETMQSLLSGEAGAVGYAPVRVFRGTNTEYIKPPRALAPNEEMARYLLCDRGFVATSTTVVRTQIARDVRYDEGLKFGQDTDFAIRLWLSGQKFKMAERPGAIWEDTHRADRVSSGRKGPLLIDWLTHLRPIISRKAYLGYRGWAIAKGLVATNPTKALRYYAVALLSLCYTPGLAAIIFAQIFLSDGLYRKAANGFIRWRMQSRLPV